MKGPFGLLLLGGGIILIVGIFTKKITFPGTGASTSTGSTAPDPNKSPKVKPGVGPGGAKTCPAGYILATDGNCYSAAGI